MDINKELITAAKEIEDDNEKIANEILDVKDELTELDKQASLINPGDRIVCLNPVQGIYKGRIYLCGEVVAPNFAVVREEDGTPVGIFRMDRFCLDNNEY